MDSQLRHILELIGHAKDVTVKAVFGPEHGLLGEAQDLIGVDKYQDWRKWITQVDALMHKEVRLVGGEK